ncbi:MAG TPA: hypothetical protein VMD30_12845 [Tepidisphaeraceae bacterium]|nr:hypothetical protein [Tepidisphaeraceae bacterium]
MREDDPDRKEKLPLDYYNPSNHAEPVVEVYNPTIQRPTSTIEAFLSGFLITVVGGGISMSAAVGGEKVLAILGFGWVAFSFIALAAKSERRRAFILGAIVSSLVVACGFWAASKGWLD